MKRLLVAVVLAVSSVIALAGTSVASAAPYCGITWGSLPKTASGEGPSRVVQNVRTGRHHCYDRMVVDLSKSGEFGYDVRYVSKVRAEGSGKVIPLAGGAKLRVIVRSPSYDAKGNPTYDAKVGKPLPGVDLTGYKTFRSAKFAGSFEGQTTLGLGVRARLPFRVFVTENHVVIDVAHRWQQ